MLKRILCLTLMAVLALTPVMSMAETTFAMAGYDGNQSAHDWATNEFFTRMEERTGLSFTYSQYNKSSEWQAAKDAMFTSGELPDVLFKAALTTDELIRYRASGQLIDLKPLLQENAPNLWALLESNPDWMTAITLPDGSIGALPSIQPVPPQDAMWINQAWLDKLGLEKPTDLASLKEVLIAFRDKDPNGNGKADEVPMAFLGPWELKLLSHAYGVVVNDYNIYLDADGQVHYWPLEDSFTDLALALRDMYAEKLLDQNGFQTSDMMRQITESDAAAIYGVMFAPTPMSLLAYEQASAYDLLDPLTYGGQQVYRDLLGQITRGTFAITSACEDPAALLKWVDILYTEEGAIEAMLGKEGDVYILTEEGTWQWKGGVENVSTSRLSQLSVYDSGEMPWLFPQEFYIKYDEKGIRHINDELKRLADYVKSPFPTYALTTQQREELLPMQAELGRYVDESLARFVLGEIELTPETIAEFRTTLTDMGAEKMTAFWQNVADAQSGK